MQNQTTQNRKDFGSDAGVTQAERSRPVERDETHNLISSDKVEGTKVLDTKHQKIGQIDHLMIGKRSGRVEYAVMSFGGFLGIGEDHYPVPWDALDYSPDQGGYIIDVDAEKLKGAPSYAADHRPEYNEQYGRSVYAYYGVIY